MDKKPLILENTKLVLPTPIRHLRTLNAQKQLDGKLLVHGKEAPWYIPRVSMDRL